MPKGKANCTEPISGSKGDYPDSFDYDDANKTLRVGDGAFSPVEPEVYNFEVSGLKVVQSWLGYRMKMPKGKKSSPLDEILPEKWTGDFTTELLELLWMLEATIELYPNSSQALIGSGEEADVLRFNSRGSWRRMICTALAKARLMTPAASPKPTSTRVLPPIPQWISPAAATERAYAI